MTQKHRNHFPSDKDRICTLLYIQQVAMLSRPSDHHTLPFIQREKKTDCFSITLLMAPEIALGTHWNTDWKQFISNSKDHTIQKLNIMLSKLSH